MRPHEAQPARGGEAASADWRAYAALARMAFQRQLAYRFANVSGLLTNGFFGLLRAYVLIALFGARHAGRVAGYSIRDATNAAPAHPASRTPQAARASFSCTL